MKWKVPLIGLGAVALISQRVYMKITTEMFKSDRRMDGKTVVVTGANTGIGKEAARDLAKRGARVILACRDMNKAKEARDEIVNESGNENVVVWKLDLASFASVREFAKEINKSEPKLDVLINNAGVAGIEQKQTEDGIIAGMQVNHFGPFLLTNLLTDLMKKSAPSRVIFVSSHGHFRGKLDLDNLDYNKKKVSNMQLYGDSKVANVLNSNELARRLDGTGVTVNSLHPGLVLTDIWRNVPGWLYPVAICLLKVFSRTATEGAQTTIYLAVSEEVENVSGKYFVDCKESKMSDAAKDEALAKKLWERSEQIVAEQSKKATTNA